MAKSYEEFKDAEDRLVKAGWKSKTVSAVERFWDKIPEKKDPSTEEDYSYLDDPQCTVNDLFVCSKNAGTTRYNICFQAKDIIVDIYLPEPGSCFVIEHGEKGDIMLVPFNTESITLYVRQCRKLSTQRLDIAIKKAYYKLKAV